MGLSNLFGSAARHFLTAAALAAATAGIAPQADAGVGSQSNGESRKYLINLDGPHGEEVRYFLPMPGQPKFRESARDIISGHLAAVGGKMNDVRAADMLYTIKAVARDAGIEPEAFASDVGLSPEAYEALAYQAYRHEVTAPHRYLLDAAREQDLWRVGNNMMQYGNKELARINRGMMEAARKYPDEPAFRGRMLTIADLQNVRKNAAHQYVAFGRKLLLDLDQGRASLLLLDQEKVWRLEQVIEAVYLPAPDFIVKEDASLTGYNSRLLEFMDQELARHNITGTERDRFYSRLVEIHNHYDRLSTLKAAPPVPVAPAPRPAP